MIDSITLTVVRQPNGKLLGRTLSDDYNVAVLRDEFGLGFDAAVNLGSLRRRLRRLGFVLKVSQSPEIVDHATPAEEAAWEDAYRGSATCVN